MLAIQAIGRTEIHRHSVLDHAVLFEDLIEHMERPARIAHVVFRNDLEPADHGLAFQNVMQMGNPQAHSDAILGEIVKGGGRHARF